MDFATPLLNYGVLGLGCIALIKYVIYLNKKADKQEEAFSQKFDAKDKAFLEALAVREKAFTDERDKDRIERKESAEKLATAISNNSNVVSNLQTLLESFDRRLQ